MYFRPLLVMGKTVAAVAAAPTFRRDILDFLAACLERSVALLGMKLRRPGPPLPHTAPENAPSAHAKASSDTVDEALHEEARQAARSLIADIKLYCEQEVRDGRVNGDLYRRLRNEIENGRRQYRERIAAAVLEARDYFHEELVRVLAEDDLACLGADYPGAAV
jgi:hypothetical protein